METFTYPLCRDLRAVALALPETDEGTSCVNRAFRARKKNFLFLGEKDGSIRFMAKLTDSLTAASAMKDPRLVVGKFGWVTLNFPPDDPFDRELLASWVLESFRAFAPKTVLRQLDG
jgi:hypothetical protein